MQTLCKYCGELYPIEKAEEGQLLHHEHPNGCPVPLPPNPRPPGHPAAGYWQCYFCGIVEKPTKEYKKNPKIKTRFADYQRQFLDGKKARCNTCCGGLDKKKRKYFSTRTGRFVQFPWDRSSIRDEDKKSQEMCDILNVFGSNSFKFEDAEKIQELLGASCHPARADYGGTQSTRFIGGYGTAFLWDEKGRPQPYKEIDEEGNISPYRPLTILMRTIIGLGEQNLPEHEQASLHLARLLIEYGAPLDTALHYFHQHEGLDDRVSTLPAIKVLKKAQKSVDLLLMACRRSLAETGKDFDFMSYFEGRNPSYTIPDACLWLTEKAVLASEQLRPYYTKYTFRRMQLRLESQKGQLFAKLPWLPNSIESNIVALAKFLQKDKYDEAKVWVASRVPDPIVDAEI